MAKTIKQIACEVGVTKQAVFKKIDNLGLRDKLTKNGNQFAVDDDTEALIKQGFSENDRQPVDDNQTSTVDALVDMLRKELDSKNKQISDLQDELAKERIHSRKIADDLAKLADQAQQLQAGSILLQAPADQDSDQPIEQAQATKKKWKWPWQKGEQT